MNYKIFFLFFSLFCLAAEAESANSKRGFYAGLMGGIANLNTQYDLNYNLTPPVFANYNAGQSSFIGGALIGYHIPFTKFYLEPEVYILYQNTQLKIIKDGGWNGYSTAITERYNYGICALLGLPLFNPSASSSAYIKGGMENGVFNVKVTKTPNTGFTFTNSDKSKQLTSWVAGVGLKTFVRENLFLRIEYTYLYTPHSINITTYDGLGAGALALNHKFTPNEQRFMLSIAYQF